MSRAFQTIDLARVNQAIQRTFGCLLVFGLNGRMAKFQVCR